MPGRAGSLLAAALLLGACAEPFDETRQDLVSFRIAAVGVQDGVAAAALWSGGALIHHDPPALAWTLDGVALGTGWGVPVSGYGELGLTATSPDGDVREAVVTVGQPASGQLGVTREAVELSGDLDLASRLAVSGAPIETSAPSDHGVRLVMTGRAAGERLRWMVGGGEGTLLELDEDRADALRQEVRFEEDEAVAREDLGDGFVHTLVLGLDDAGGNRWTWADAVVGDAGTLLRHEGRLVPAEGDLTPGLTAVTVEVSDTSGGVRLSDAVVVDTLAEQDTLSCAPAGEPFRLAWIAEGRCLADDVREARVVLETW